MLAGSSARPRSRPLRLLECRVIPSLLSSSLCPLVTHWLLVLFHEMVPYIDDSHVRRWKKLPRNRHIRSMSYHPSLRSNLSSLRLELTHQQFNSLQYHEASFAERYRKLLQLVYCRSKTCQQSSPKQ